MRKEARQLSLNKEERAAIARPIFIFYLVLISVFMLLYEVNFYSRIRDTSSLFEAVDNFQHVTRIVLHYDSKTFEANYSDYNFDDLKTLLNPREANSSPFLNIDTSSLEFYSQIDYFTDNKRIFSANIYLIPDNFIPEESSAYLIYSRSFSVGNNKGIVLISNYNQSILSRFLMRDIPIGSFHNNKLDISKVLELLESP